MCIKSGMGTAELGAHLEVNAAKCNTEARQQISCRRKRLYFPLQLWLFLLAARFFSRRLLAATWTVSPAEVWTVGHDKWARSAVIHCCSLVGLFKTGGTVFTHTICPVARWCHKPLWTQSSAQGDWLDKSFGNKDQIQRNEMQVACFSGWEKLTGCCL